MDKYGLINLTELDRQIEELANYMIMLQGHVLNEFEKIIPQKIKILNDIKSMTENLPTAENIYEAGQQSVFIQGDDFKSFKVAADKTFEDFINEYLKSENEKA